MWASSAGHSTSRGADSNQVCEPTGFSLNDTRGGPRCALRTRSCARPSEKGDDNDYPLAEWHPQIGDIHAEDAAMRQKLGNQRRGVCQTLSEVDDLRAAVPGDSSGVVADASGAENDAKETEVVVVRHGCSRRRRGGRWQRR